VAGLVVENEGIGDAFHFHGGAADEGGGADHRGLLCPGKGDALYHVSTAMGPGLHDGLHRLDSFRRAS
jgi:hypothetical protein